MSKDKKFTLNQTITLVHNAYDHIEEAAQEVLKEEFKFDPQQMERFMMAFGEKSAEICERIRRRMAR